MPPIAGTINVKINGELFNAKGSFSTNIGNNKLEAVVGADRVHGAMSKVQVPFIEGEFTDDGSLDIDALTQLIDATVTIDFVNGKTFVLNEAWFANEGTLQSEEGNIGVRFESTRKGKYITV